MQVGRKDYLSHSLGVQGNGVMHRVLLLRLRHRVVVTLGGRD